MHSVAIPRVDPGVEGIEVLWTWPEALPLSARGYDVLRISGRNARPEMRCEVIGPAELAILRASHEMSVLLGPIRLRIGAVMNHLAVSTAGSVPGAVVTADLAPFLSTPAPGSVLAAVAHRRTEEFIQELLRPTDLATVAATAKATFAIAFADGKAVATGSAGATPAQIVLRAPGIDRISVYTVGVTTMTLCVSEPDRTSDGGAWADATVVARGLTLPIHQADPGLATPGAEYAAAKARLVGAEALDPERFARAAATIRAPVAAAGHHGGGTWLALNRSNPGQTFEEMTLDQQLTILSLHPKLRRVLGFGVHDRAGLIPGAGYIYRVVGHFDAADLTDAVYDVHRVPAETVLPDRFWIADVSFRFQVPVKVVLDPAPPAAVLHATARRGIRIDTGAYDLSWLVPAYGVWSALITLPHPVTSLVLEVAPGHGFTYAAGLPWAFGTPAPAPLPAGPLVTLTFPLPVHELRLSGTGTLYALRLPSGHTGIVEVHADTAPVVFAATPLPAPPVTLVVTNLQQPPVVINGPISEATPVPPRPPVGFRLTWLPAPSGGVSIWPDNVDSGPPLDALAYAIEHRSVTLPATFGPWQPITADDNLTFGTRGQTAPDIRLEPGCDLDALFPRRRPSTGSGLTLTCSDVFGEADPTTRIVRPAQLLGSHHQYRIRAVDVAGRISGTDTLSGIVRLETHVPPPLPAGPQPPPGLDVAGHPVGPTGPRARAVVRGAAGLTADDVALLGTHANAVVLEWGWRQAERDLDPATAEFRVYATRPADKITGKVTAVASLAPGWHMSLVTNLPLVAGELAGQWITSGGYPFLITANGAGLAPGITVELSQLEPLRQPQPGEVTFGRPLRSAHQRPAGWDARVATYPLTTADSYRHVFFDLLTLDAGHPRDSIWVGVSAADDQSYVPDERTGGPFANRPGNESGIVTCAVTARFRGQPVFSVPPPLGDVPELVTEEPTGRQVLVTLDVAALAGGVLPPGSRVALERCGADEVLSRTRVDGGAVIVTTPDGVPHVVAFPNPDDDAAVLAALGGPDPQRLPDRYLLHLVAATPDPSVFFTRPSDDLFAPGPVGDRLAPKPGRFLYLIRAADAAGHLSAGSALLPIVVRVPSVAPAVTPVRRAVSAWAGAATLTVAVPPDPNTVALLLFASVSAPHTLPPPAPDAELLRVPNRRDLFPADGLRLRLPDGTLLAPAATRPLSDLSVAVEADGTRTATLSVAAAPASWVTMWCYALTRDGQPSRPCGPFGQGVPA